MNRLLTYLLVAFTPISSNKKCYLKIVLVTCLCVTITAVSYAQLSMPSIFSDNMVLQRGTAVNIWGKAKPGESIKVKLGKHRSQTEADSQGEWKITVPSLNVGKPLQLTVESGPEQLKFKNVLVGEVWVCSGQSNMRWYLKNSTNGKEAIKEANLPKLRLLNMISDIHPGGGAFNKDQLDRLKRKDYFRTTGWKESAPETAEEFSAVAYYFGKLLLDSLQVPIGLIHNAVGGATTDSWIDRVSLMQDPDLQKLVDDENPWPEVEGVNEWVKRRSRENLALWADMNPELLSNHPFAPGYLYETGIEPLLPFSIKGVIWYQGESNATNPEMYSSLFELLVSNWRMAWSIGDFPFIYVQLPKIGNRNRWPEFREAQRKGLDITNTAMVVSIDTGHPTNVHPKQKKVIGERMAAAALGKWYGKEIPYMGPVLKSWIIEEDQIRLEFNHSGNGLTVKGEALGNMILEGYNEKGTTQLSIQPSNVEVSGNKVFIGIPEGISITAIKYAWLPYPEEPLLYNSHNLPASPFKLELPGNN